MGVAKVKNTPAGDSTPSDVVALDYYCPKCHSRNVCFFNCEYWHCLACGDRWVYYEVKG